MLYFIKLAECGSLSRAAELLFISHQGLSKIVASMEDELGCKLITRGHAGVELTEDGKIFLEYAHDITRRYSDLKDALARHRDSFLRIDGDHVSLTATHFVLQSRFMGAAETYPHVLDNAIVREVSLVDIPEELEHAKHNDVFFVHLFDNFYNSIISDESYMFEEFATTEIGIIWRDKPELEQLDKILPEDVLRYPLACASDNVLNEQFERLLPDEAFGNVQLKSSNSAMLIDWAQKGRVVSLFDSFAFELGNQTERFRRTKLKFTPIDSPHALVRIGFLYKKINAPGENARNTMELIKAGFANFQRRTHG